MARELIKSLKFRQSSDGFDVGKLEETLVEAYLSHRRANGHMQKKSFSPSSIGYGHATCPRYWSLAFTGGDAIDDMDAMSIAVIENGSKTHERVQQLFKDSKILIAEEFEIKMADPPVRGYGDVLVKWEGESIIGEIKSTRQEIFAIRRATMKPSVNHLYQILLYMKATNKKHGFIMYENKNTQEFLLLPITMDEKNQKILEDALEWMRGVHKDWTEGIIPVQPVKKPTQSNVCKQCPFLAYCWNGAPKGTKEVPLMEVPTL